LTTDQIDGQLSLAVDRVMSEGSLYDRRIAALAIKQARGDTIGAIFLVRAYHTTLPRFGFAEPLDKASMTLRRRVYRVAIRTTCPPGPGRGWAGVCGR
jgi:alpha-D-ribose 1-methylphosphonate 5-triphosphate synthase subunit PhnI